MSSYITNLRDGTPSESKNSTFLNKTQKCFELNQACHHGFTASLEFLNFFSWLHVHISHFTYLETLYVIGVGSKNRAIFEVIQTNLSRLRDSIQKNESEYGID